MAGFRNENIYGESLGIGIGQTDPTARLELPAGTAAAGTAPLKLTAGTNLTTPEPGAVEFNGTNLFYTTAGGVRQTLAVGTGGGDVVGPASATAQAVALFSDTTGKVLKNSTCTIQDNGEFSNAIPTGIGGNDTLFLFTNVASSIVPNTFVGMRVVADVDLPANVGAENTVGETGTYIYAASQLQSNDASIRFYSTGNYYAPFDVSFGCSRSDGALFLSTVATQAGSGSISTYLNIRVNGNDYVIPLHAPS